MSISSQVSEVRKNKGFTQEELAALTKVTVRTIQRIESGESQPRPFTLKAIAAALEVPFSHFTAEEAKEKTHAIAQQASLIAGQESASHFLQVFCLSCFTYLIFPYVHFLKPTRLLNKSTLSSLPIGQFAQNVIRLQGGWVVTLHLLLVLTLAYNLLQARSGSRQHLVNYLWIVLGMYLLNAVIIGGSLLKARRLTAERPLV